MSGELPLRTEAESLAIALQLGFVPVSVAVAWADAQIAASDVPDIALCDVAMASTSFPQTVASMLRSLPGEHDHLDAVRGTVRLGLVRCRAGTLDVRAFARGLYDLAIADDLPESNFKSHAYSFWDGIDLARDGMCIKSETEVVESMLQMCADFVGDADT